MPNFTFPYQEFDSITNLSEAQQELIYKARQSCTTAYAPYSNFKVGCAVELGNQKIITGANVENASYPAGICAERTALAYVVSNYGKEKIIRLAISYSSEKQLNKILFPCGICRQFITECQQKNNRNIEIILSAPDGKTIVIADANHLLPFGFNGEFL